MQKDEPQVEQEFESLDGETRQIVSLTNLTRTDPALWQNLHRYEIAAARAYHRALRTLRQLQAERRREEQNEEQPEPPSTPHRAELIEMKSPNEPNNVEGEDKNGGQQ
jgi:hypothetical protein